VEVRDDQADVWKEQQRAEMVRAGETLLKRVPVQAEVTVSSAWEH